MLRKKAILLIHGFAGGAYDYGNLPNDLEFVNNYKVFTYTLPGHDKAIINKVTKDDWIKMSEMQIEKIIKHGYKEIYVIGHSMGGVIAAYLASKYKEVKKLVLAAPAFQYFKFDKYIRKY
jgi:carboxylesterase